MSAARCRRGSNRLQGQPRGGPRAAAGVGYPRGLSTPVRSSPMMTLRSLAGAAALACFPSSSLRRRRKRRRRTRPALPSQASRSARSARRSCRVASRHRGRPRGSEHLVRGRRKRRRLEDGEPRDDLDRRVRGPDELLDRLPRRRSERDEHGLGRDRRERQRTPRGLRGRHLPQPGRRAQLGGPGPRGVGAHREHCRAPRGRRHALGRGSGPALVTRRRARRLQDHRRRGRPGGRSWQPARTRARTR